jgi:phage gp36-like protein
VMGNALTGIPDADLAKALEASSAEVDSYLRNRFTLPLTTWGADLRRAVCILAAFDVLSVRGLDPQNHKQLESRRKAVVEWLVKVKDGDATPAGQDANGATSSPAEAPWTLHAEVGSTAGPGTFWQPATDEGGSSVVVSYSPSIPRGW